MPEIPKITDPRQIAKPKKARIGPRLAGALSGLALSEETERQLALQQKFDEANFLTGATLDFRRARLADFERSKSEGDVADPDFMGDFLARSQQALEDILRNAPKGVSREAVAEAKARLGDVHQEFFEAALRRQTAAREWIAFDNLTEVGLELAAGARRDPFALPVLLESAAGFVGDYAGVLTADQEQGFLAALRARTITSAVEGLAEAEETDAARELLESREFGRELGPEKIRRLSSRIAKVAKERAADNAEKAATEKARRAFELQVRVSSGAASEEELDQALATDAIGREQHARLIAELERQAEDRRRRTEGIERIADLIARGEKPDPDGPGDRQAVEAHFESIAGAFDELSPEDRAAAENLYVAQTGVLPAVFRDTLLGGLLSDDPGVQVAAAQRLAKLEKADPALVADIPEVARTRARAIAALALPGLTPERAMELAEERLEQRGVKAGIASLGEADDQGSTSSQTEDSDENSSAKQDPRQDLKRPIFQPVAATQVAQAGKGSAIPQVKNPNSKFWDDVITRLLKREKGFNPADPSNRGIKDETLEEFLKRQGKPPRNRQELMKKLRNLTEHEARQIYREIFIKAPKLPGIPDESLAEQVFDAGVRHSPKVAGQLLQKSLDEILGTDLREPRKDGKLIYDGDIGPKTRAALARAIREGKIVDVNNRMVDNRVQFMKGLSNFKVNPGWVPRAESFRIQPTKP